MDIFSFEVVQTTQYVIFKDDKAYFLHTALQGLFQKDIEVSIHNADKGDILQEADQTYISFKMVEDIKYRFPESQRETIMSAFKKISEQGAKFFQEQTDSVIVGEMSNLFDNKVQMSLKSLPIRYDYCNGLRVAVPDNDWTTTITDRNTGLELTLVGSFITNTKWCIPWDFEIKYKDEVVFKHEFNLEGKKVVIAGGAALGDSLAWTPYYKAFKDKNKIKDLWVTMGDVPTVDLLKEHYADDPHLHFMTKDKQAYEKDDEPVYACYTCGLHFAPRYQRFLTPIPVRNQHLPSVVSWQLNMKPEDAKPLRLTHVTPKRLTDKPYVCVAGLSTSHSKNWTNPTGWHELIFELEKMGYRVFDIDRDHLVTTGTVVDYAPIPNSPTIGDFPLRERAETLAGADFFVGPSSGLCWIARAVGCPTVMIGGFTLPINEYDNPYRAWNPHGCVGCMHDGSIELNRFNYAWCPRHNDNSVRKFECGVSVTSKMVLRQVIKLMRDYELNPLGEPRKYMCDLETHLPMK